MTRLSLTLSLWLLATAPALAQAPEALDELEDKELDDEEPEALEDRPKRDVSQWATPVKVKTLDRKTIELQDREKKDLFDPVWTRDTLGFRFGPVFNGLFDSNQGQPLSYPSFGARYKHDGFYFDLNAPALFGLVDGASYLFQEQVLYSSDPFSFFETFNTPKQYAFFEVMHLRLGRTFSIEVGGDKKTPGLAMELTAGLAGTADFVLFDVAILGDYDPEEIDLNDIINYDPIVLAPALFVSLGRRAGNLTFDVALEVGRDLFDLDSYFPSNVWIVSLDADIQVEILPRLGVYVRPRYTLYPGIPTKLISSFLLSTGALFRF